MKHFLLALLLGLLFCVSVFAHPSQYGFGYYRGDRWGSYAYPRSYHGYYYSPRGGYYDWYGRGNYYEPRHCPPPTPRPGYGWYFHNNY